VTPESDKPEHDEVHDQKQHEQADKDEVKRARGLMTA
jgi:hypothetical protein